MFVIDVYQPGYIEAGDVEATRVLCMSTYDDAVAVQEGLVRTSVERAEETGDEDVEQTVTAAENERTVTVGAWAHRLYEAPGEARAVIRAALAEGLPERDEDAHAAWALLKLNEVSA